MNENDAKLVADSFKKYYFDHLKTIHTPDKPQTREFGFQKFNTGMIRHQIAKDDKELHLMIMQNNPSDVYCSNGYYTFPNLPMAEKDWQEADLIFDIDAKDLNLPCRKNHVFSKCNDCQKIFAQSNKCPNCQSIKLESKSLPCMTCIDGTKQEVKKLQRILVEDLGVNNDSIIVYFSGNEGFHVYVYNTQFQRLSSRERGELADYIMFRGAIPAKYGMKYAKKRSDFPEFGERGWRGRVAKGLFGTKSKRSKIITEIIQQGTSSFEKRLVDMSRTIGANIDPNVTMDVHRIFRLPGSLNSKSGLAKILCTDLDSFRPYDEACLLDDEKLDVTATVPFEFSLKNKKFGPYDSESVSVPRYAAVYMICKGLASVA